jgi:RimJ/RimL family protein N-acetyltransferase
MSATNIHTRRLKLVAKTLADVRAQVAGIAADQTTLFSPDWLAQLNDAAADLWTLGFDMVQGDADTVIGTCGFKGPPGADGIVEIAYGVASAYQGNGYATEAAEALVAYAFRSGRQVRVVRAHTISAANASARVLIKCGFQSVGEIIDPEDGLVWRWERQHDSPDSSS